MTFRQLSISLITLSISLVFGPKAVEAASLSVVADGLDNPRNIGFGADGSIYVTESGRGGDGTDGRCIPSPSSQFIPLCAGNTSSLLKINTNGTTENVLSGLPSLALTPSGEQAAGIADIKFDSQGFAYLLTGYAGNPNVRDTTLKTPELGKLFKFDLASKELTGIADFASYELQNNPDGTDLITNPYAMEILGDKAFVIDGGGNTVYSVGLNGGGILDVNAFPLQRIPQSEIEFPPAPPGTEIPPTGGGGPGEGPAPGEFPITYQSVPTAIAKAPDGTLTVGEYTYFPYPQDKARIYSVNPDTLDISILYEGFNELTGVTYDDKGNLYALQHLNVPEWKVIQQGGIVTGDISSSLIKIATDGTRETIWNGNGLEIASGLFFGPDGDLYTSNRARLAGTGQVLKFDLDATAAVPEPSSVLGVLALGTIGGGTWLKRKKKSA